MIHKNFSLQLDDATSLRRLAAAVDAWNDTLVAASKEVGANHVLGMVVSDLSSGSAVVEVLVEFDSEDVAQAFDAEVNGVSVAVAARTIAELPRGLQKPATALAKVVELDGGHGMVLGSESSDVLVEPDRSANGRIIPFPSHPGNIEAMGSVRGRLQKVSSRQGISGTLFDEIFDKSVRVYFAPQDEEQVRDHWDKLVLLSGSLRRDSSTGRPLSIRDITDIEAIEEPSDKYAWRSSIGALRGILPDLPVDELIRKARGG